MFTSNWQDHGFPYTMKSRISYPNLTLRWESLDREQNLVPQSKIHDLFEIYQRAIEWVWKCEEVRDTSTSSQHLFYQMTEWQTKGYTELLRRNKESGTERVQCLPPNYFDPVTYNYDICRIDYKSGETNFHFGSNQVLLFDMHADKRRDFHSETPTNWGEDEFVVHKTASVLKLLEPRPHDQVPLPEARSLRDFQETDPRDWKTRFRLEYTLDEQGRVFWKFTGLDGKILDWEEYKQMPIPFYSLKHCIYREQDNQYFASQCDIVYPHYGRETMEPGVYFGAHDSIKHQRSSFLEFRKAFQDLGIEHRIEFDRDESRNLVWWRYVDAQGNLLKKRMIPKIRRNLADVIHTILSYRPFLIHGHHELIPWDGKP